MRRGDTSSDGRTHAAVKGWESVDRGQTTILRLPRAVPHGLRGTETFVKPQGCTSAFELHASWGCELAVCRGEGKP